jgi:protein XagA
MKNRRGLMLYIILIVLTPGVLKAGGGWTNPKGKGFFKLAENVILANYIFTKDGEIKKLDLPINMYTTNLYGEYGITDRITAVAYVPFFVRATIASIKSTSGKITAGDEMNAFGDVNLSLKYGIITNRTIVVSGSITLGLPTGETSGGKGGILQSGDGEFNQLVKIEASHSFYPKPFYASVMVGYNNRTKGFSDEFHASAEVGVTLNKFIGILKFYNLSSLYNGISDDLNTNNTIFSNNTEYLSFTPEVLYKINDQFGLTAASGFAFSAKRILAAPNLSLGVFFNL